MVSVTNPFLYRASARIFESSFDSVCLVRKGNKHLIPALDETLGTRAEAIFNVERWWGIVWDRANEAHNFANFGELDNYKNVSIPFTNTSQSCNERASSVEEFL